MASSDRRLGIRLHAPRENHQKPWARRGYVDPRRFSASLPSTCVFIFAHFFLERVSSSTSTHLLLGQRRAGKPCRLAVGTPGFVLNFELLGLLLKFPLFSFLLSSFCSCSGGCRPLVRFPDVASSTPRHEPRGLLVLGSRRPTSGSPAPHDVAAAPIPFAETSNALEPAQLQAVRRSCTEPGRRKGETSTKAEARS